MVNLTDNQKQMIYWITERDRIRKLKESGLPAPWSENPVMQSTYFCNVNREDDKVTQWIRSNWRYPKLQEQAVWYDLAMITARIFNLPSTLERLGQPLSEQWIHYVADTLKSIKAEGGTIWNGAYIISTNGRKVPKDQHCFELMAKIAQAPEITSGCTTLAQAHKALMQVDGLASFLAAQVVADLKNSAGHPLSTAPDWHTFSAFGPGSLRGLTWFFEKSITAKTYQDSIDRAYDMVFPYLPQDVQEILCHQNFQNCFCEFDKFMRVTNGTGKSKRKYNGAGGQQSSKNNLW